jgi:hypothetical protein
MPAITPAFNSATATWEEHRHAFFSAIKAGDTGTVGIIAQKYPEAVGWRDKAGHASLHIAFARRDMAMFQHLLDLGAKTSQTQLYRNPTLLFLAKDSETILNVAARNGRKDFVTALLERGESDTYIQSERIPRAVRYEIIDLLEAAGRIRKDYLARNPSPLQMAAAVGALPAASLPDTAMPSVAPQSDINVLKPVHVQRRAPNAPA